MKSKKSPQRGANRLMLLLCVLYAYIVLVHCIDLNVCFLSVFRIVHSAVSFSVLSKGIKV